MSEIKYLTKVKPQYLANAAAISSITFEQSEFNYLADTKELLIGGNYAKVAVGNVIGISNYATQNWVNSLAWITYNDLTWANISGNQSDISISGFNNDKGYLLASALEWDIIGGDQSDINLSDFNDDLSYDNYSHFSVKVDSASAFSISSQEALNFVAGDNISLTYSSASKYIRINSTGSASSLWTATADGVYFNETSKSVGIGTVPLGSAWDLSVGSNGIYNYGSFYCNGVIAAQSTITVGGREISNASGHLTSHNAVADGTYNNPTSITVVGGIVTAITV